jgi:hypothetical protein
MTINMPSDSMTDNMPSDNMTDNMHDSMTDGINFKAMERKEQHSAVTENLNINTSRNKLIKFAPFLGYRFLLCKVEI